MYRIPIYPDSAFFLIGCLVIMRSFVTQVTQEQIHARVCYRFESHDPAETSFLGHIL